MNRNSSNDRAALDAAMTLLLHSEHHSRRASERGRLPVNEDKRTAPANVANEPRACSQRGDVPSPKPPGTPGNGPLVGAAERIGSRRLPMVAPFTGKPGGWSRPDTDAL